MRRITRRIGLFGGPGAIVRAAGAGKGKRPTRDNTPPEAPPSVAESESGSSPPSKKSWLDWLRGEKGKPEP